MLEIGFARRLVSWGNAGVFAGLAFLALGVCLAYVLDEALPFHVQLLGHLMVGLGAFGLKGGYIARLAALDVLKPHPEGWRSESKR